MFSDEKEKEYETNVDWMDNNTEYYWFKAPWFMNSSMEVIAYQTKCAECAENNVFGLSPNITTDIQYLSELGKE